MQTPDAEAAEAAREGLPGSGLLDEIGQLGHGVKELMGAQIELASAELDLARSAFSWSILAGVAAIVIGSGFGLTVLALLVVLLAHWFGSWLLALAVLAVVQGLLLLATAIFLRRCLRWMSLPTTRAQWSAMMRDTMGRARRYAAGDNPP